MTTATAEPKERIWKQWADAFQQLGRILSYKCCPVRYTDGEGNSIEPVVQMLIFAKGLAGQRDNVECYIHFDVARLGNPNRDSGWGECREYIERTLDWMLVKCQ